MRAACWATVFLSASAAHTAGGPGIALQFPGDGSASISLDAGQFRPAPQSASGSAGDCGNPLTAFGLPNNTWRHVAFTAATGGRLSVDYGQGGQASVAWGEDDNDGQLEL